MRGAARELRNGSCATPAGRAPRLIEGRFGQSTARRRVVSREGWAARRRSDTMRIHIIRESGQGAESGAWRAIVLLVSVAIACALGPAVRAQCPADWLPGEGHPGVTGDLP